MTRARVATVAAVAVIAFGAVYRSLATEKPLDRRVNEVTGNLQEWAGRPVRLFGAARLIQRQDQTIDFRLERNGQGVRVRFTGIVPSTFTEGAEIAATGRLEGKGDEARFHARAVLVKGP